MKYINKNLIVGESIELETNLHWINFINLSTIITLGISPYIEYKSNEFAITNKRVIFKWGFIRSETFEMSLNKIETINVKQSILGRIFGYGDITIIGSGGSQKTFKYIKDPLEFRKKFVELSI